MTLESIKAVDWKQKVKQRSVWIPALIIVVIAGYAWRSSVASRPDIRYTTASAKKTTIVTSLTGTGQISAENTIELKPQASGNITAVRVKLGQRVKTGDVIVTLDSKSAVSALNQARVSVESARASYNKLIAGATNSEIELSKLSLSSVKNALQNAQASVTRVQQQQDTAVSNAQSALLNTTFAAVSAANNLSAIIPTISGAYKSLQEGQYEISFYQGGDGLRYKVAGLETYEGPVTPLAPERLGIRGLFVQFPSGTNIADTWTVLVPNTRSSSYLSNYNAVQTALQNRTTAVDNAAQAVITAEQNVEQVTIQLEQKQEAANPADVAISLAQLHNAEAQLYSAQAEFANYIVRAPFDGQIATLTAQRGLQASSGAAVATLITQQQVAKVTLNEVDAAKAKLDQKVTLTFDALEGLSIAGHIVVIDAVGTVTQGVVSYTVTVALDTQDVRVKPGMSVTASIVLDVKSDVIAVPSAAIKTQAGMQYVDVFASGTEFTTVAGSIGMRASTFPERVPVEAGMSSDTMTEIVSGIVVGDTIVIQTTDANAVKTTAGAATGVRLPGVGGGATRATGR